MEVFEAVRTLLAVRSYRDTPISNAVVRRIAEPGRLKVKRAARGRSRVSLERYTWGMDINLPPVDTEAVIRALLDRRPAIMAPAPTRFLLSDLWNVVVTTSSGTNAWTADMALTMDDQTLIDRVTLDGRTLFFPLLRV